MGIQRDFYAFIIIILVMSSLLARNYLFSCQRFAVGNQRKELEVDLHHSHFPKSNLTLNFPFSISVTCNGDLFKFPIGGEERKQFAKRSF